MKNEIQNGPPCAPPITPDGSRGTGQARTLLAIFYLLGARGVLSQKLLSNPSDATGTNAQIYREKQ